MIQINNLSKVFRTSEVETVALDHVNLEVNEGEFVAIMGPSGCGKSTLLNILGLLDNPTEGSYKLLGQEVAGLHEKERTRVRKGKIGFVFQSFNLIDELNVFENVELPLTYLGMKASERIKAHEHQPPCQPLSAATLRRTTAACGHRPRRGDQPETYSCRRAYRKPRLEKRRRGHQAAERAERRRHHHHHGDSLATRRLLCPPHRASV